MATLHGGSRNWPILGDKDGDWASFAYLWPNYVRIDHKNIDNGTGNVAANTKTRKANLHSILALATQNNMQAREIIESRQTPEDDGAEPVLDGEADFAALRAHFEPKLQIYVGLKTQELDACFEQLFASWETSFDESVAKLQAALRECGNLRCKPTEQQLLTKFLAAMPDSGPWGQRKVMWTESTMSADGESTNATLADMINKARMAYLQLKNSPEAKTGARAFAARVGKGNCDICGHMHTGECWYRSKAAYAAMTNGRGGRGGGKNGKRGRSGGCKPKCYNCGKRGHIARDCTEGDGDDDDSELDDATLRKAAKQLRKKARARHANVTIPGC